MEYREHEVPRALSRHIECIWELRDGSPGSRTQTIFPDGRCELIAHLAPPPRAWDPELGWHEQARLLFAAQQRHAIRLVSDHELRCVGVRLAPAASAAIAGAQLAPLRDRIVNLELLDADFARAFGEVTARTPLGTEHAAELLDCLQQRLSGHPLDERVAAAAARMDRSGGQDRVDATATALGMSLRSLQARFLGAVGLTVKEYARVLRLQATIQALDRDGSALAQLASGAGFSDQAHATRELRQLTGSTPARLRAALREDREGERTLQLAAAFVRGHAPRKR